MTTEQKLIRNKLSLIELAEYLQNVSQVCRINGVARQHFYDIKKVYEEEGIEGLKEKSQKKICIKNRGSPEIEEAVVAMSMIALIGPPIFAVMKPAKRAKKGSSDPL